MENDLPQRLMIMTDPVKLYSQLSIAFDRREWEQLVNIARELLPLASRHPGVYYMTGIANMELQRMTPAVECLRMAGTLEPSNPNFAVQHARALTIAQRNREAKDAADRARSLAPTDALILDTLGVVYTQIGQYEAAADVFGQATARSPGKASYRYNLATALVAAGDIDSAEAEIEACLAIDPTYWRAHLTLAQLRRQTSEHNHVPRLKLSLDGVADSADTQALVCLHMAMAKEYEDLAEYSKALDHLVQGKSAGAKKLDYRSEKDQELFATITASFPTRQVVAPSGYDTSEPIFIIGMPRSGTTLVERIVSSHPEVQSAGELLNFGMSLKQISGSRTPGLIDVDTIERARNVDWRKLGETYLTSTRPGTGQSPRFIDKLPHNFLYAGFIANALPQAKIICLRRNPMDTCLSNFRQLFAPNSPYFDYSFDLLDTGRYYVLFHQLMAHWEQMFPGRIMQIDYETLVDTQEASSRQLLEFCGLSWDENCLKFEENPSPVATASAVQVRAPIYRSALRRWKKYGAQLDALHDLLVGAGITID